MNEIWEQISGYVMPVITAILSSGLGAALVRILAGKWFRKADLNKIAERFAEKLAGSSINVDLTAVTEKQLALIKTELTEGQKEEKEKLNLVLEAVNRIITEISKSAKLSKQSQEELTATLEEISAATQPIEEKEQISIRLKASETKQTEKEDRRGVRLG